MSLEDLGNIGEFVAAVAVVVSLIYLAVQLRQNTAQLVQNADEFRLSFRQQQHAHLVEINTAIFTNRDVGELIQRARTEFDSLDGADRERWRAFMTSFFRVNEGNYLFALEGLQGIRDLALRHHLRAPSARRFWRGVRETYEMPFREFVDSIVDEIEAGEDSDEAMEEREVST